MTTNLPQVSKAASPAKLSPLQLYLREVAKYPLLSPEEEYDLAVQQFEDDDVAAAHKLITSNLRLVVKIANDFRQAQISTLDLIQEGNYGLMHAVKRFNPYKGVKLSSYAAWWIRAFILKFIMDNKSQVKIGTTAAQRKLFYNLKKEADKLIAEYDRADTKLLAERLDVKEDEVIEMQKRLAAPDLSLDAPVRTQDGESSQTRGDLVMDQVTAADELLSSKQIQNIFKSNLSDFRKTLGERDLFVLEKRILAEKPMTLQAIGEKYDVSRERARQIENAIVKKLKKFVKEKSILEVDG